VKDYRPHVPRSDGEVGQLLSERPAGWEYLLLAGALVLGIDRLETNYSDYMLGYAPRLGTVISAADFHHFIMSQLNELELMVSSLNRVLADDVMSDAVGLPGEPGNPDKIFHMASRVVRLYEDLMLWAERLRGYAMPDDFRHMVELLVRFSEQPINELRDFTKRLAAQVDEMPSAIANQEQIVIDEVVTFRVPDAIAGEFGREYRKFTEKLNASD
jgi:hypothetical protein